MGIPDDHGNVNTNMAAIKMARILIIFTIF